MNLITEHRSPNFDAIEIDVSHLILHYTACTAQRALEIFKDPAKKVCAHFIIDLNGDIYDLGGFYTGPIRQGAHAGQSRYEFGGRVLEKFNEFSIGIELVNLNGNLFSYKDEQYEALNELTRHLQSRFVRLQNPQNVLGHEHIAGYRGKADPGLRFDWKRFYKDSYGLKSPPARPAILKVDEAIELQKIVSAATAQEKEDPLFWTRVSSELESKIKSRTEKT